MLSMTATLPETKPDKAIPFSALIRQLRTQLLAQLLSPGLPALCLRPLLIALHLLVALHLLIALHLAAGTYPLHLRLSNEL